MLAATTCASQVAALSCRAGGGSPLPRETTSAAAADSPDAWAVGYVGGMTRRRLLFPAFAVLAALAATWATRWLSPLAPITVPAATWRHGHGDEIHHGRNYEELAAETAVRLSFACDEPRHVYVFSHSREDGTLQLFPHEALRSDLAQPVPPGRPVLPGRRAGRDLAWTTRSGIRALTTFVAIAAREPVPELEALLGKVRHWSTSVLADGSMQVTQPALAANEPLLGKPGDPWAAPILAAAAELFTSETDVNGPMLPLAPRDGVWCTAWRVKEKPGTGKPFDPQHPELPEALKPLQAMPAPPERR